MAEKPTFWQEIRRRKIVQFALIYAAVGWLLTQISATIFPTLGLPTWSFTLVIVIVALGFPLVIVLAWAHETAPANVTSVPVADSSAPKLVTDMPSIAVLPFINMSDDREQDFLADGMTEDIITALAKSPGIFVIARNSSYTYKGKSPDVRDVGRDLGVRFVLEGSIRAMGERVRITAQLIEAATGGHLWSENYDRPTAELLAVQDEVVNNICDRLNVQLRNSEHARAQKLSPDEMTAWTWVAKAQNLMDYSKPENFQKVKAMLDHALEAEPDYPYALAMLGHMYAIRASSLLSEDVEEDRERGLELVRKARRLAPEDAGVVSFYGEAHSAAGEYETAIEALERARQLAPNSPQIFRAIGFPLIMTGRAEEGIKAIEQGMQRDPSGRFGHGHSMAKFNMGVGYAVLDNVPEAIRQFRGSVAEDGGTNWAFLLLASFLQEDGQKTEAEEALGNAFRLSPDMTWNVFQIQVRALQIGDEFANRLYAALEPIWPEGRN